MAKPKRKRWKRKPVARGERTPATPETIAKLKPWPMQALLAKGPSSGGIDADQFEACVQIVEGFKTITRGIGHKPLDLGRVGHGNGDLGPRACRLWNLYVAWGNEFLRRTKVRPHVVVDMIEDERTIDFRSGVIWICLAADLWDKVARDMDRNNRKARKRSESVHIAA